MKHTIENFELKHSKLERIVPVCRHLTQTEPRAWVILSVGYGGSRSGYAYLARSWATLGITTFVVEHVGSNLDVLKSFSHLPIDERNREVIRRVHDSNELNARPADLALLYSALKDELGHLPLGLAGHSFGSYSVLASQGLKSHHIDVRPEVIPARALLVMSPQPPGMLFSPQELAKVDRPILVATGTKDGLLDGSGDYRERLKTYECLPADLARLIVFEGTEHMMFAGLGLGIDGHLKKIAKATSLWWSEVAFLSGQEFASESWKAIVNTRLNPKEVSQCL